MLVGNAGVKDESDLRIIGVIPGKYHVVVKDVDEVDAIRQWESIIISFEVLAGTNPGQEKKVVREFFSTSELALPRLDLLAIILGLKKPGEVKEVVFSEAVGRQLIVEIVEHEYKGKKRNRPSQTGFWRLDDPDVKDIPRDRTMESMARTSQAGATATAGTAKAATGTGSWGSL